MDDALDPEAEIRPHELVEFLRQDQVEMAAEYARIYARTLEDPGTAGDEGEENWAALLREWLPDRYQVVTKGRVVFPDGYASRQIDVLVLRGSYPPRLLNKKLYLSSGVVAAFECKNTLRATHVRDAIRTASELKSRLRRRFGSLESELRVPLFYGLLAHSHSWRGPTSAPIENVDLSLLRGLDEAGHPSSLIDIVCVADLAAWTLSHRVECPWFYAESIRALSIQHGAPADGGVNSQFTRFAEGIFNESVEAPNPIAVLIAHLLQRLGWGDEDVRPIADFFRVAGLMGTGKGPGISFGLEVFSESVRQSLLVRPPVGGPDSFWDDWSMTLW